MPTSLEDPRWCRRSGQSCTISPAPRGSVCHPRAKRPIKVVSLQMDELPMDRETNASLGLLKNILPEKAVREVFANRLKELSN
jgi:hypothetical protein